MFSTSRWLCGELIDSRTVDIYLKWRERCDTRRPGIAATCTGKLIPRTTLLPPKIFYVFTIGSILAVKIAKIRLTLTKTTSRNNNKYTPTMGLRHYYVAVAAHPLPQCLSCRIDAEHTPVGSR